MLPTIRLSRAFNALIIERHNGAIYHFPLTPDGRQLSAQMVIRLVNVLEYTQRLDAADLPSPAEADARLDPQVADYLRSLLPTPKTPEGKIDLNKLNLEDL